MKIALLLLLIGIMFIITGYTHQVSPSCDKGTKLKLVNKEEFNRINDVDGISASHFGSPV
jgi:hypothetical protein